MTWDAGRAQRSWRIWTVCAIQAIAMCQAVSAQKTCGNHPAQVSRKRELQGAADAVVAVIDRRDTTGFLKFCI